MVMDALPSSFLKLFENSLLMLFMSMEISNSRDMKTLYLFPWRQLFLVADKIYNLQVAFCEKCKTTHFLWVAVCSPRLL